MIDKETIEWIEKEGLLHQWIRLVLGLNDSIEVGDKSSDNYVGKSVGNSAEAIPLDNSLLRDVRTSVDCHVGITSVLPLSPQHKPTPQIVSWHFHLIHNESDPSHST